MDGYWIIPASCAQPPWDTEQGNWNMPGASVICLRLKKVLAYSNRPEKTVRQEPLSLAGDDAIGNAKTHEKPRDRM
jgi:hypothetical protein